MKKFVAIIMVPERKLIEAVDLYDASTKAAKMAPHSKAALHKDPHPYIYSVEELEDVAYLSPDCDFDPAA